jgi:hypothetical protein
MAAATAGLRLDEALRGLLAEQGSKRLAKEELSRLVGGTMRLRLTAHALARFPCDDSADVTAARDLLGHRTEVLSAFYEQLARRVGPPRGQPAAELTVPTFDGQREIGDSRSAIWVCEHIDHLAEHLPELVPPAAHLAEIRRRPWWR